MKHYRVELLALMLGAALGYAQTATTVNQGSPGKQGPWPVTGVMTVIVDGGTVSTVPLPCSASSPHNRYATTGGPQTVGGAAGRVYTVVTNNGDGFNGGTGFIKCRADGVAPALAAGTPGTVLTVGNSVNFTNTAANAISCIGAAGQYIGTFECVP